ncbi:UDP-N-acetylmuramate dehydrogenase [Leptotrichia wadei]|uniref:UDP-N-acetylenolpyruvoylglucosamine reductase n=2 Tax=Leptotrichia wadei TaxID=157687 RepID=A0A510JWR8_9FUSO|nr:UDP-N-acetylmuramate dehydrogenase [Leptotrichia wadei]ERK47850.1 UDP-N-acetylmuramate dehydrogenase [Leptotrichia wadei F0279]BBM43830.1 UDP-N-acetylenolpyruvoylglucosamine reductase [Leptotrichia wadei]BBM50943.1 UDP-N-acetylenolpyruvoylglucosamine reductase [Leptotrichia wadei]
MEIVKNAKMKEYSNMKVGGTAKELIFIDDKNELKEVLQTRNNIFLLGNGTNTLINDGNLDISFLSLKRLKNITVEKKVRNENKENNYDLVRVEAGLDLDDLIEFMEKNDYSGLENITGIPGSVGGLVNMNGGAYGTEIFDCIEEVEVCKNDGEIIKIKTTDLNFKYRTTEIKENKWIVISALFKFGFGFDKAASEDKRQQRKVKHPLDLPNLGSTFKNPKGKFAARLISDANLKGYRVGDAAVSTKHPNFVTNLGNATFNDVISVIEHVKEVVFEKFGIKLETEIIILKK